MSGTCLIDVLENGDFERFLSVNGVYDLALDSQGIIAEGSFSAYPWTDPSSDNRWKTGNPVERRAPSGRMVEEWVRVYDECHGTRNDLASPFDALDTWELPSTGASAGTLTVGGTQFDGHVFCKRSWWHHLTRNRYCIERAIAADNLWVFIGSHSGTGGISGSAITGGGTGSFLGRLYTVTITSGTLTSTSPVNGSFAGTLTGAIVGTFTGTIVAGVVTTIYTITSPTGTLTQTSGSFAVGGGGTTFTFAGAFSAALSDAPAVLAENYIAVFRDWTVADGGPTPIRNGKFNWINGWRRLLFPWEPAAFYLTAASITQVAVGWDFATGQSGGAWTGGDPPWDTSAPSFTIAGSNAGASAQIRLGASTSGLGGRAGVTWMVFPGPTFSCSSGTTITRPRSTLRNLFGWDEDTVARVARGAFTGDSFAVVLGFFWHDLATLNDWEPRFFETESTILGAVGSSEANFNLTSILDIEWPATSGSANVRRPCFWIGPEWGTTVPIPATPSDPMLSGSIFSTFATDNAATAGVNHNIRWIVDSSAGGQFGPRIGTTKHPFKSPLGGLS
jgi:hypothetical protein